MGVRATCWLGAGLVFLSAPALALTCNPVGAKADGVTKDSRAIQAAIDDCAAKGGGTVALTKGVYVSAPLMLKEWSHTQSRRRRHPAGFARSCRLSAHHGVQRAGHAIADLVGERP